jgi:hypothetical protein
MFKKKKPPPSDFQSRVQAYEAARKKGLAFQAEGTVGGVRVRKRRRAASGGRFFGLILVVGLLFTMKAALFSYIGPDSYRSKLAPYSASDAQYNQVIAYVMQPDPVTRWLAKLFSDVTFQAKVVVQRYAPQALR